MVNMTDEPTFTSKLCDGSGCALWQCWTSQYAKLIAKVFPNTKYTQAAFEREVSILSNLNHRHIITYVGSYTTPQTRVILTKDGGESLLNYAQSQHPLTESSIRMISKAIIEGLVHCHAQQICHGDVKLHNIVLNKRYRVRLIDFGLAERIPEGKTSTMHCGSTFYWAPELIRNEPHDLKVDVWALGISLFVLATGQFPFCVDDEYTNAMDVLMSDPDLSAITGRFSNTFVDLIRAMLRKKAEQRPTLEECLQSKWFKE
jgi:serine/threonine protein kinase